MNFRSKTARVSATWFGKRAGRGSDRGPEKIIAEPLGALPIAERVALLSGRDDEFVAVTLKTYTGMRGTRSWA